MKHFILAVTGLWMVATLGAQTAPMDLSLALSAEADADAQTSVSTTEKILFQGQSSLFDIVAGLSVNGDGKYGADIANFSNTKKFFNNYFFLDQGYTDFHVRPLDFRIGRYAQYDTFDSPYSLFLNSQGHSALGMTLKYDDRFFSYESRWISLNQGSDFGTTADTPEAWRQVWDGIQYVTTGTGFPDRGASLKTYTFHLGPSLDVGIQDAAVYTGRSFDAEYFFSPIPSYFTQYVKTTAGRPWTTSGNENNLIGFFVQWKQPEYEWGAQVLIDDFSLHFLFPDQVPNNPWKAAWTVGGRWKTDVGRFGLFHAGALKYTFEPISTTQGQDSQSAYGYFYYPDVEYSVGSGDFRTLSIEDNALGYLHGENNLALEATYDNQFTRQLGGTSSLEFVLAGANSPANPWHDVTTSDKAGGTQWLNDSVLSKTLVWKGNLAWTQGEWVFYAGWKLGYTANVLTLESATGSSTGTNWSALDRYVKIFKPSGDGRVLAGFTLGATWTYALGPTP